MARICPLLLALSLLALGPLALGRPDLLPITGALALTALLVLLTAASSLPALRLYGPARTHGPRDGDRIALTFDDGPDPASTPALLDALRQAGARATFFVLVDRARRSPELLAAIAAEHEVALHGARHDLSLVFAPPARGAQELRDARATLEALGATPSRWFRPPFGIISPRTMTTLAATGLELAWCSLRTHDGVRHGVERLVRVCRRARAGDIVVLHEGERAAREALPRILEDLTARGLRSVTVSELLE